MEQSEIEIWDRQEGETLKAYQAFCVYRDIRPGRSLLEAYKHQTGKEQAGQVSGQWKGWYDAHKWRKRAEAYDGYLELQARKAKEAQYDSELAAFRTKVRTLSNATLTGATNLLTKAGERLKELDKEQISAAMLPAYFRAAAAIAEAAMNTNAQLLAIDDLIRMLSDHEKAQEQGGVE